MSVQEWFYAVFLGGRGKLPKFAQKKYQKFLVNKKRIVKPKQISIEYSFNV